MSAAVSLLEPEICAQRERQGSLVGINQSDMREQHFSGRTELGVLEFEIGSSLGVYNRLTHTVKAKKTGIMCYRQELKTGRTRKMRKRAKGPEGPEELYVHWKVSNRKSRGRERQVSSNVPKWEVRLLHSSTSDVPSHSHPR